MPSARPRHRTAVLGTGAALTLAATLVAGVSVTPASADGSFRTLAAADGARMTVVAVNGPATNVPVDLGAPVAQASLDSLGTNQSFASQPYPGDLAVSAPGLMAGVSNGQVAPPNYPLYVSADYPIRPEQTVEQPGYQLKATAAAGEVAASARSGEASAERSAVASTAAARTVTDGGTVTGDASTIATGFAAGPLTIGRISSTASVTRQPDGAITRRSALDISGARIGDTAVSITPQGITVGTASTPVPDGAGVQKVLSDAGVTVKYLAGSDTENGLVAPALEVSWTKAVPGPVTPLTLIWTLGRTVARIDGGGGSGAAIPTPVATEAEASTLPAAVGSDAAPGTVGQVDQATSAAVPGGQDTALSSSVFAPHPSEPAVEGSSSGSTDAAGPAPTSPEVPVQAARLMPPDFDLRSSFGALALALLGTWIVSRRWTSNARQSNN